MGKYITSYAHGKFYQARNYLALGRKTLSKRICGAFLGDLLMLQNDDLPDDMRADFAELRRMVSSAQPDSYRGSVEVTLSEMHWKKLYRCAELIVDLATRADQSQDPKWATGGTV